MVEVWNSVKSNSTWITSDNGWAPASPSSTSKECFKSLKDEMAITLPKVCAWIENDGITFLCYYFLLFYSMLLLFTQMLSKRFWHFLLATSVRVRVAGLVLTQRVYRSNFGCLISPRAAYCSSFTNNINQWSFLHINPSIH